DDVRRVTHHPDVFASSVNPALRLLYFRFNVKVRIKATPREAEVDGVRLDTFVKGDVREVSAIIGSWLIAGGYAEPGMRQGQGAGDEQEFTEITDHHDLPHDRPDRRRSSGH